MLAKIIRDGFYDHIEHLCPGCAEPKLRRQLIRQVQAATGDRLDLVSTVVYDSVLAQILLAALGQE